MPSEYVVEYSPLKPIKFKGTPNSLGLRLELDARHFAGSGGTLRVRCLAYVGSFRYETDKHVQMAHANNQRFSAGDLRSRASGAICGSAILLILATSLAT